MKKEIGQKGEDIACEYLKNKGYKITDRNFRCKLGEIDIIAKRKKNLVFIEVKAKQQKSRENLWPPELNITEKKRHKLRNLSSYYLSLNKYDLTKTLFQIDVIAVEFLPNNEVEIRHLENAVSAQA